MSYRELMIQAVIKNDTEQILDLLNKEPSLVNVTTEHGLPLVLFAMYYNQADVARFLASRGAILDIFSASALGKLERVRELVEANATLVNSYAIDGYQPLGLASFFGQLGVVRYLISKGADVNCPSDNEQKNNAAAPSSSRPAPRDSASSPASWCTGQRASGRRFHSPSSCRVSWLSADGDALIRIWGRSNRTVL